MEIRILYNEDIDLVKEFVHPQALELEEADTFWYVTAFDEKEGVLGVLVLDTESMAPEILSLGISPKHMGEDIESALIDYTAKSVYEGGTGFIYAQTSEEEIAALLERKGFEMEDEINTYSLKAEIIIDRLLRDKTPKKYKDIVQLKDMSDMNLRSFNRFLSDEALYTGVYRNELDGELSLFSMDDNEVTGCILVSKVEDKLYEIAYMYSDGMEDLKELYRLFAMLCQIAEDKDLTDAEVIIPCINESAERFVKALVPGIEADNTLKLYRYNIPGAEGDPVFELVDTKIAGCEKCKYYTGDYMSCDKYNRKPGCVFYDEPCPSYEE